MSTAASSPGDEERQRQAAQTIAFSAWSFTYKTPVRLLGEVRGQLYLVKYTQAISNDNI